MSKAVTLDGDVTPTPGETPPPPPICQTPADGWEAGAVSYTLGDKIRVNGTLVALQAECTFTWTGALPPIGCTSTSTSKVTLSPGTTKLTDNGNDILVDGDEANDAYGNTLTATPSQTKLKTA